MVAKLYFDTSHLYLTPSNTVCRVIDDENGQEMFVLSDKESLRSDYCTIQLAKEYGRSINNHASGSVFGFSEFSIEDIGYSTGKFNIVSSEDFFDGYIREFNKRASFLEALLTFLWFVKDNSVGLYGSFGQIPEANLVNGKTRSVVNYNATGRLEDVCFSQNDILCAANLVSKYSSICGLSRNIIDDVNILKEYDENGKFVRGIVPKISAHFNYENQTAIDRALHFLVTARTQNYLMYRIAYYMPVFECLFNTSGSEISFRLAQRVAFYIGENAKERKQIFDDVSSGYNYRSKFIHGAELDKKANISSSVLMPLAVNLDNYLRRILTKVICLDHEIFIDFQTNEKNTFFDSLVMGVELDIDGLKKTSREKRVQSQRDRKKQDIKRGK